MDTILTPIIKDKKGNISSKDNYRPIAVTSVISKVLESVILDRYKMCFITCDSQFGFKNEHSIDLCTFTLKHVINYYHEMSSPVFVCYLDASKAFDRLNFWSLFDKLLNRGMPDFIVRLLMYWYTHQCFYVRWGASISEAFYSSNGVRQGGVLSPHLFNVYVDDLSQDLILSKAGCFINNVCVNHLMYADDTVLLAPSARGLQHLLSICQNFANDCDITFNLKKTVYMCFKTKSVKMTKVPQVFLNDKAISLVNEYKYLGFFINDCSKDDCDINHQLRNLYARGNTLIKTFKFCSDDVKIQLFKTYCSSFYSCHLWAKFSPESLRRICVAYNRVFRIFFGLYQRISMSKTFIDYGVHHFNVIRRKYVTGFLSRLENSDNSIICEILCSSFYINSSMYSTWCKIAFYFSNTLLSVFICDSYCSINCSVCNSVYMYLFFTHSFVNFDCILLS